MADGGLRHRAQQGALCPALVHKVTLLFARNVRPYQRCDKTEQWNTRTADYLIAHPFLAEYRREGLDLQGYGE